MAFAKINWKPNPKELRTFGCVIVCAMGLMGSLFYFGGGIHPFLNRPEFSMFLWGFGLLAFLTAITGTKLGMPTYLLWMGFVFCVSTVIGYSALVFIYLLVVTPLGLLARLVGRDKLSLKKRSVDSYWEPVTARSTAENFERQY